MSPLLVLFAKAPVMGRVKTRLARDIGPVEAMRFCRASIGLVLRRVGGDRRWRVVLATAPDREAFSAFACWRGVPRTGQGAGDLGARMGRFLKGRGGPVVILGADAPDVTRQDAAHAFQALRRSDAVFGPAEDGGYWLIGLRRRRSAPRLFEGVRWSTENALADTRATLPPDFRVAQLRTLSDVDDGADWRRMRADRRAP